MKKRIFPFGLTVILYSAFFLMITGVAVFIMVVYGNLTRYIILSVVLLLCLYICFYPLFAYTIQIDDDHIIMKKDNGLFKEDRIQYETDVNLKEAESCKLIKSDADSLGNKYGSKVSLKKYLEFSIGEEKKRIYVSLLSQKQLLKLKKYIEDKTFLKVEEEKE